MNEVSKDGGAELSEIFFAVGFCRLFSKKVFNKLRRARVLDIIFCNPGCNADQIARFYLEKYAERLPSSTLSGDTDLLVRYGLCEFTRLQRSKYYQATGFTLELSALFQTQKRQEGSVLLEEVRAIMKS